MSTSYVVGEGSRWEVHLELTTEVPDTSNTDFPGGGTVRPKFVNIGVVPDRETGLWGVWNASVVGPKIKDGKVSTKRDYAIPFMSPLDEDGREVAPEWLRDLCQEWVDRANGISTNSPARGEAEDAPVVDELASGLINRQIKIALDTLERDAKDLAERSALYAGPTIRKGMVHGDMSRLAQDAQQLALAAARLDGMREIARVFVEEI